MTLEEENAALRKQVEAISAALDRAVVLPCNVGDMVYKVQRATQRILERKVSGFVQLKTGAWWILFEIGKSLPTEAFGKVVLPTRAQAVAAMEKEGKQND